VNVEKDGFLFAAAAQIPKLMADFENGPLRHFTPCHPAATEDLARSLAIIHVELILIHPFREGNGRVVRLLAVLMGLQASLPLYILTSCLVGSGSSTSLPCERG
jgi:cell filamentation protein